VLGQFQQVRPFRKKAPQTELTASYSSIMDRIDRQIIHCLQRDGRAPFRVIADALEVSEQTIARRFRRLLQDGAVRVLVSTEPLATGEETWFVRMQCRPDSADVLAEALAARDDVSWVSVTTGGGELICVIRSDPAAVRGSVLLQRLPKTNQVLSFAAYSVLHMYRGGESEWMALEDPLSPEQIRRLKPPDPVDISAGTATVQADDAPLLAALAADGRASVAALARATGWPQSRVATRVDELLGSGAAYVDLDMAPPRFGFSAIAYLWLTVAPGDLVQTAEALSAHPETSFAAAVTGSANLLTAVTCRDSSALYTYVTTKVGALPAIRQLEIVPTLRRVKQAGTLVRDGRLVY
jgi:DNA-binding Lrp family transcriptional regulator